MNPAVTICVLTFGDYTATLYRCLESIRVHCDRKQYLLFVGCNAGSSSTLEYLTTLHSQGHVDRIFLSDININKCPMMRRMFAEVDTEFIWWLDDDSHLQSVDALSGRLKIAVNSRSDIVMWGHVFFTGNVESFSMGMDVVGYVKSTPWYRGRQPPSYESGGAGDFNFEGRGIGDGRWFFICGACWFIRTITIRELDWPDRSLLKPADDMFLCEAIRQNDWYMQDIGPMGVAVNDGPRRGEVETEEIMRKQIGYYDPHLVD